MFDVRYHVHMTTKTTVSITEARKRIFDIAEQVQRPNVYYTLTDKGRPKVVVMSAEEFESWAETLEVMREFPDLDKDIAEADSAVKTGAYKQWPTLDDIKKAYRIPSSSMAVAEKPKKKYGVHPARKAKSSKKHR